jgi:hypothetical protein
LSLQGVDDVKGGDGLALGVFCVGNGITDDTLEEGLEDTSGFFVDHWEDASGGVAREMEGRGTYWLRYA